MRVAPVRTTRRHVWFAAVAVCGSLLVAFAAALLIDLYLHAKYERTASVNRWGYCGPVMPRKVSNERRDSGVVHVHLGRAIDLRDPGLAYDGMHLTPEANALIAQAFVEPVLRIAAALDRPCSRRRDW
jgi:hypothetical protein